MTDRTNDPTRPRGISTITLAVDDGDAMGKELSVRGGTLPNGPTDRPWGIRTAGFRAPGGHIREIAP